MSSHRTTKAYGLSIAKKLKELLQESNIPVQDLYLYGSYAKGLASEDSDIDIAVICQPFKQSKIQETVAMYMNIVDTEPKCEIHVLYPSELNNPYSIVASELRDYGIVV